MVFVKNRSLTFQSLSDQELIHLILGESDRNHCRLMQEELYERYVDKVYFKCISIVKDAHLAQDLTHDILVKVLIRLLDFKSTSPFYGWVSAIAYNSCMTLLKQRSRHRTLDLDSADTDVTEESIENENSELREMQLDQLEKIMEELNEKDRLILLMRYQDDMSVVEIGQILELGDSAVKMRLKRSRDRLAELFKSLGV
ncbi:MAG: sigma-70 family RNA polymerase sigma factor [Saprospiraceae bacterium]|nr:sigma-70 family RNA polymerase sigma factor [Saprospiraceae bacterium]